MYIKRIINLDRDKVITYIYIYVYASTRIYTITLIALQKKAIDPLQIIVYNTIDYIYYIYTYIL